MFPFVPPDFVPPAMQEVRYVNAVERELGVRQIDITRQESLEKGARYCTLLNEGYTPKAIDTDFAINLNKREKRTQASDPKSGNYKREVAVYAITSFYGVNVLCPQHWGEFSTWMNSF